MVDLEASIQQRYSSTRGKVGGVAKSDNDLVEILKNSTDCALGKVGNRLARPAIACKIPTKKILLRVLPAGLPRPFGARFAPPPIMQSSQPTVSVSTTSSPSHQVSTL